MSGLNTVKGSARPTPPAAGSSSVGRPTPPSLSAPSLGGDSYASGRPTPPPVGRPVPPPVDRPVPPPVDRPVPPPVDRPLPPPVYRPVPPPINVNPAAQGQIDSIASMTLQMFNQGMYYSDARTAALSSMHAIEGMGYNPVANFADKAISQVSSDETAYQIAKNVFQNPDALNPYNSPDAQVQGISTIATRAFDTGMYYSDARTLGNSALQAIDQIQPNPEAEFTLDAANRADSDQEAYNIQRAALNRPETMRPSADPATQVRNIAQLAMSDFDQGLYYSTARQVGDSALRRIQQVSGSAVAQFAMQAASRADSDQEAYNIQRQALQNASLLAPAYPQQQQQSIARVALAAFDQGLYYSTAKQVGMDALNSIQALGYNPMAAMALNTASQMYDDQSSYQVLRQALQNIAG